MSRLPDKQRLVPATVKWVKTIERLIFIAELTFPFENTRREMRTSWAIPGGFAASDADGPSQSWVTNDWSGAVAPGKSNLALLLHSWLHCRMVLELKLRKVGNSVGVVLPKDAMAKLNVREGDSVCLTDAPDGSLRVTPVTEGHEQFAQQMKTAEALIRRYRNTLRELAK